MENLYPGLTKRKNLLMIMAGIAAVIALIEFISAATSILASASGIISGLFGIFAPVVTLLFILNIANLQGEPLNKFAIPAVLGVIALQNLFTAIDWLSLPGWGFLTVFYIIMALIYGIVALCFGVTALKLFTGNNSSKLILTATIIIVVIEVLALLISLLFGADTGIFSLLIGCVLALVSTISMNGALYLLLNGKVDDLPFGIKVD